MNCRYGLCKVCRGKGVVTKHFRLQLTLPPAMSASFPPPPAPDSEESSSDGLSSDSDSPAAGVAVPGSGSGVGEDGRQPPGPAPPSVPVPRAGAVVTTPGPFACNSCPRVYKSRDALRNHRKTAHADAPPLPPLRKGKQRGDEPEFRLGPDRIVLNPASHVTETALRPDGTPCVFTLGRLPGDSGRWACCPLCRTVIGFKPPTLASHANSCNGHRVFDGFLQHPDGAHVALPPLNPGGNPVKHACPVAGCRKQANMVDLKEHLVRPASEGGHGWAHLATVACTGVCCGGWRGFITVGHRNGAHKDTPYSYRRFVDVPPRWATIPTAAPAAAPGVATPPGALSPPPPAQPPAPGAPGAPSPQPPTLVCTGECCNGLRVFVSAGHRDDVHLHVPPDVARFAVLVPQVPLVPPAAMAPMPTVPLPSSAVPKPVVTNPLKRERPPEDEDGGKGSSSRRKVPFDSLFHTSSIPKGKNIAGKPQFACPVPGCSFVSRTAQEVRWHMMNPFGEKGHEIVPPCDHWWCGCSGARCKGGRAFWDENHAAAKHPNGIYPRPWVLCKVGSTGAGGGEGLTPVPPPVPPPARASPTPSPPPPGGAVERKGSEDEDESGAGCDDGEVVDLADSDSGSDSGSDVAGPARFDPPGAAEAASDHDDDDEEPDGGAVGSGQRTTSLEIIQEGGQTKTMHFTCVPNGTGRPKWQCVMCKQVCTTIANLKQHLMQPIAARRGYPGHGLQIADEVKCDCGNCKGVFATQAKFRAAHKLTPGDGTGHASRKAGPCPLPADVCGCGVVFARATELERHVAQVTEARTRVCGACGNQFGTAEDLRKHVALHCTTGVFPCTIAGCKYVGKTLGARMEHLDSGRHVDAERKCKCPWPGCAHGTRFNRKLKDHIDLVHVAKPTISCTYDGCLRVGPDRGFKTERDRKMHVAGFHRRERRVVCQECGWVSHTVARLQTHIRKVHLGETSDTLSTGERLVREALIGTGLPVGTQYIPPGYSVRYDAVVALGGSWNTPLLVEYDGAFHYRPRGNKPKHCLAYLESVSRDLFKTRLCQDNGVRLLRLTGALTTDGVVAALERSVNQPRIADYVCGESFAGPVAGEIRRRIRTLLDAEPETEVRDVMDRTVAVRIILTCLEPQFAALAAELDDPTCLRIGDAVVAQFLRAVSTAKLDTLAPGTLEAVATLGASMPELNDTLPPQFKDKLRCPLVVVCASVVICTRCETRVCICRQPRCPPIKETTP